MDDTPVPVPAMPSRKLHSGVANAFSLARKGLHRRAIGPTAPGCYHVPYKLRPVPVGHRQGLRRAYGSADVLPDSRASVLMRIARQPVRRRRSYAGRCREAIHR
jgi:hypothetical protein